MKKSKLLLTKFINFCDGNGEYNFGDISNKENKDKANKVLEGLIEETKQFLKLK